MELPLRCLDSPGGHLSFAVPISALAQRQVRNFNRLLQNDMDQHDWFIVAIKQLYQQ
jgi:hypothetical protein